MRLPILTQDTSHASRAVRGESKRRPLDDAAGVRPSACINGPCCGGRMLVTCTDDNGNKTTTTQPCTGPCRLRQT
jgi:hypothetical protein